MQIRFTDRELDVMAILWREGSATAAEVQRALAGDDVDLAYNTVLTILRILEDKGYVTHDEEGRAHRYRPTVARAAAKKSMLDRIVDKLFEGSHGVLATHLVSDRLLDATELRELRRLLDQKEPDRTRAKPRRQKRRKEKP